MPVLLCFAAYTPMQPPIILGLMWPNASVTNMLFWQVRVDTASIFVSSGVRALTLIKMWLGIGDWACMDTPWTTLVLNRTKRNHFFSSSINVVLPI